MKENPILRAVESTCDGWITVWYKSGTIKQFEGMGLVPAYLRLWIAKCGLSEISAFRNEVLNYYQKTKGIRIVASPSKLVFILVPF